jgi:membrane associated rhomboid family serine protease
LTLLVAMVVVFALGTIDDDLGSAILNNAAQVNELIRAGEWWRVLSATMLHGNLTHLLFNGYALYALGVQLERGVGSAPFAALYIASALAGGIAFLVTSSHPVAVGASGAIFGLFGAWFAASWVNRDTPQGRAGVSQFGLLLLINLALPLFVPNIAWQAHVGGLVAGALIGLGWARRSRRTAGTTPAERVILPATLACALLAGLLWYTLA